MSDIVQAITESLSEVHKTAETRMKQTLQPLHWNPKRLEFRHREWSRNHQRVPTELEVAKWASSHLGKLLLVATPIDKSNQELMFM